MADIATLAEFASFLQTDVDNATSNLLLLDLAQGLVAEVIGEQTTWPKVAKSIALAAAGRAYRNPEGLKRATRGGVTDEYNAEEMGVYLADSERGRLKLWLRDNGGNLGAPTGAFPEAISWPDPADWFNLQVLPAITSE